MNWDDKARAVQKVGLSLIGCGCLIPLVALSLAFVWFCVLALVE